MSEPGARRPSLDRHANLKPAARWGSPNRRAGLWMIVSGVCFSLMGVFVKIGAQRGFTAAELVFYRSAFGLIVITAIALRYRLPLQTPHPRTQLSRSVFGLVSLFLYFYCLALLPIATAVTLNYTSPIFLALVLAFSKHERPSWQLIACTLGGFAGVLLLLRPTVTADQVFPALCGLASGVLATGAYMSIRRLGELGEPDWRVVFYFTLVSTLGAGLWLLLFHVSVWRWSNAWILLAIGAFATAAQLAMTRSFQMGKPLLVGSLSYSAIVFASILGVAIWRETLPLTAWLGMAVIIASGIFAIRATPH